MMDKPKLLVTEDANDSTVRILYIENFKPAYKYHVLVDGVEVEYETSGLIVKGEGKHSVSVTVHRDIAKFEWNSNINDNPASFYDKGLYDSAHTVLEFYIDIPYGVPANVISLKHNTYDTKDPEIMPTVDFEVWTHPFIHSTEIDGLSKTDEPTLKETERISHGNGRYVAYTYEGSVTDNCILKSIGKILKNDGTIDSNSIYKVSDWTFNGDNTKSVTINDMKNKHPKWYNMYNDLIKYKRQWNIENWNNDTFKDLLGYYKYRNPANNRYYESSYKVKEYRTVDTFLDILLGSNTTSGLTKPEILGIDSNDETQIALYPGVVRGMNQYYAAWVDDIPFELNDRTELTSGDLQKESTIRTLTQSMRRNRKKEAITDNNKRDYDSKEFKIDTIKPQFPQVNIDLESVMRNPFQLDLVKEGNDVETKYQLRRIVYKYYSRDPEEMYNYENIIGDCTYEEINFTIGNYIWEDGDYILDVWNYREVNKVFRHRSFYFTINTLKNMDILPLKAKIIPLKADKWEMSMDGEMLLDWITGDYYINVDGVIKSATVKLNNNTSKLEETEFQRLVDAADYMDMLEDDIRRYNANKDLIEEMMKDIYRLLTLYKEYMKCITIAKRDTAFDRNYIDDLHAKLRKLYESAVIIEGYLEDLDRAVEEDKLVAESMKNSIDNDYVRLDNIEHKISLLKDYNPDESGTNKFKEFIADVIEKQKEYVKDKTIYKPDLTNYKEPGNVNKPDIYYTIKYENADRLEVVNEIDGVEVGNSHTITILEGRSYKATVKAKPGYILYWVDVNGDIKGVKNGVVTIDDMVVTSDITIHSDVSDAIEPINTISAENLLTITRHLTNVKFEEEKYPKFIMKADGTAEGPYIKVSDDTYVTTVDKNNVKSYLAQVNNNEGGLQVHITMNGIDCSEYYDGGWIDIENVSGDIVITADGVLSQSDYAAVTITNNLTNCHNTNLRKYTTTGIPYKAKLEPDDGYTMLPSSITVEMNGEDITLDVYDYTKREIFIKDVTGPIVIEAEAGNPTSKLKLGTKLTNVLLDNFVNEISIGDSYETKIEIEENNNKYEIVGIKVIMGVEDITEDVYNKETSTINIPMVIDNVMILVEANIRTKAKIHSEIVRTEIETECPFELSLGEDFKAKIAPDDGYNVEYVMITDDKGNDVTDYHYKNGTLAISNIKNDMNIIAVSDSTGGKYTIEYELKEATIENELEVIEAGSMYTNKLYPHEGYRISEVKVEVNNGSMIPDEKPTYIDITEKVYNKKTHEINIPYVTGDLRVIMKCKPIEEAIVTLKLIRTFTSNNVTNISLGDLYQTTLFGEGELEVTFAKVITASGKEITEECYHDSRIYIPKLTEDITIIAIATE